MSLKSFSIAIFAGIALLLSACSSENSTSTTEEVIDESNSSTTEKADESSASKGSSSESKEPSTNSSSGTAGSSSGIASPTSSSDNSDEEFNAEEFKAIIEEALANATIEGCESIDSTKNKWTISAFTIIGIIPYLVDITYDFSVTPATRTIETIDGEPTIEELTGTKTEEYVKAKETCEAMNNLIGNDSNPESMEDLLQWFSEFGDFSQIPLLTNPPDLGLLPEYPQEYPNKD